jgi:hypothetical protein
MARSRPRKAPQQTWPGLDDDDITVDDETENDLLITLRVTNEEKLNG